MLKATKCLLNSFFNFETVSELVQVRSQLFVTIKSFEGPWLATVTSLKDDQTLLASETTLIRHSKQPGKKRKKCDKQKQQLLQSKGQGNSQMF